MSDLPRIALLGSPNAGKTTLFNALTGSRARVGNYPGVTVDHVEGDAHLSATARATLIDLPGLYSLEPLSLDEEVA
ncbi:MAG: FeoB small GTPase domain-containing protein, partial [Myxococcota bacterium]